ncbi:hypothetical protein [Xanthocytophaga flava]|uniref:hypothetical protein n=1 Tax=Xanthocytophaga flava TaxID=3048013 RepID=UPI0028D3E936|nr:hypothetical protein [Xanthocytophaga flavus]MDJ1470244.1 hypothetical protein [Xanthocytophaga flavus]
MKKTQLKKLILNKQTIENLDAQRLTEDHAFKIKGGSIARTCKTNGPPLKDVQP